MNCYSLRSLALTAMMIVILAPACADAGAGQPPGPHVDLSNVRLPDAAENLGQAPLLTAFGAACDGASDDAAAFVAASAWIAAEPNRIVMLPAGQVCATSATVALGDGRQRSTTLTGAAGGTSISVASCTGIVAGDAVAIKRDDGSTFTGVTASSCAAGTLTISGAYSGGTASSGNVVFTGKVSSSHGGGYRSFGAGMEEGEFPGGATVSTIRYIGAAAPTTTLGAQANATDQSLTVASIADISLGTAIGIDLDDGSRFWTWADRTPSGTTVHIGNEIPSTATSGNAVTIASNPVVRIAGPIASPVLEGVRLDANELAAIGLEAVHPVGGKFQGPTGVKATGYTAIGHYIHSGEFYAGAGVGIGDNDFQLYTRLPENDQTIGCWLRGTAAQNVAFSRNRFHGGECIMGGHDSRAAALLIEFIDNNTFIKPYTSHDFVSTAGCGLYRQPAVGTLLFPNENVYLGAAFIGGVCDGSATGGTLGVETMPGYGVYDGEAVPNSATLSGYNSLGLPFGNLVPKDYFAGLTLSKASTTQVTIAAGRVADATGNTILTVTPSCTASVDVSGVNGIDVGSKAANTWYAVFVIGNWSDGTTSCLFTATTAAAVPTPTLPEPGGWTGFLYYAYVGRFKTDGSSNINAVTLLPRGQFYIDAGDT